MINGEKLKEVRNRLLITQEQLGDSITRTNHTIINYEKGNTNPSPDTLKKIVKYFNKINLIYGGDEVYTVSNFLK